MHEHRTPIACVAALALATPPLAGCADVQASAVAAMRPAVAATRPAVARAGPKAETEARPPPAAPVNPMWGPVSSFELEDGIEAALEEIRDCARNGGAAGAANATFTLEPSASVGAAEILDEPLRTSPSGACALAILHDIRLSPFDGGPGTQRLQIVIDPAPPPPEPKVPPLPAPKRDDSTPAPSPTPAEIQATVRAQFGLLRGCYEDGLRRHRELAGQVQTRFVIEPDGTVAKVATPSATLRDVRVRRCVRRVFRGLVFPKPSKGNITVTYPIMFSPGN